MLARMQPVYNEDFMDNRQTSGSRSAQSPSRHVAATPVCESVQDLAAATGASHRSQSHVQQTNKDLGRNPPEALVIMRAISCTLTSM